VLPTIKHVDGPPFIGPALFGAETFADLVPHGIKALKQFPCGAEMVCGPISTGGTGSSKSNIRVMILAITELTRRGHPIFNQMPFEGDMGRLQVKWRKENPDKPYCMPILTEFYQPLFDTKLIRKGNFLPGWESSYGASWERAQFEERGITCEDLHPDWVKYVLSRPA